MVLDRRMFLVKNMKFHLEKNDMSLSELARKIGCSYTQVFKWSKGTGKPNVEHLMAMCRLFRCTPNDLIWRDMSKDKRGLN